MVRRGLTARLRAPWNAFLAWFAKREPSERTVLLGFGALTGVLAALGVVVFYRAIDLAYAVFYRWPAVALPQLTSLAYRPLITGAGLALAWWIVRRLGRGHDGMNVPDVQLAVVKRGGDVPLPAALSRTAASAVTIGCGGSAGSEGPVVVLGAALGSWLGRVFRFSPSRIVTLVGCATAAAISAAFNAPLAGAFFALEEILGNFSRGAFPPIVVASVVAAVVSRSVFGNYPAFPIPQQYGYASALEIVLFFPLLGVVCAVVATCFVRVYFGLGMLERRLRIPERAVPWIGGAAVGAIVYLSRGALVGTGHLSIDLDVFGGMAWYTLLLLALGKILVTAITLNFGGSGGVFTPSLFVGAATGGAVGAAFGQLFPAMGIHPQAYALVGMGAVIAGATDAPITGMLLVFEMTNDWAIVVPLMLTVVVAHAVARRLEPDSLYSGWLRRRGQSLDQGADRDVLVALQVADAFVADSSGIPADTDVMTLLSATGEPLRGEHPVVDTDGRVIGVIQLDGLRGRLEAVDTSGEPLHADELAYPADVVAPEDSLLDAIKRMGVRGVATLPVIDRRTGHLLGVLSHRSVFAVYGRALAREDPPQSL